MSTQSHLPGKFVWYELASSDAKKAQAFYAEVLGWKTEVFPLGDVTYEMIFAGDTMIGGYAPIRAGQRSQWLACVSVEDVDASAKAAIAAGGRVVDGPFDIPTVGRRARIADPQGAELYLFKSARGDAGDALAPRGTFFWNELHTNDIAQALAFYERVVGFSHRALEMGPSGAYHIVSKGGVDRGGVTAHLASGVAPHWLPYVSVEDPDGTIARARELGVRIPVSPEDIPGIGRLAVLQDPTGAVLAVMKPNPREKG